MMGLKCLQRLLCCMLAMGAFALCAAATEPDETESAANIIGTAHGYFGASVAVSGPFAVVGRPEGSWRRWGSGSAAIYEWTQGAWVERAELHPQWWRRERHFGIDVAIDGDVAAVGAADNHRTHGAVYVFERRGSAWAQVARLTVSRGRQTRFGHAVALSGNYLLVGAPADDEAGKHAGAVYVFQRHRGVWRQTPVQKLIASDAALWSDFGAAVAIMGPNAVVGAPRDDHQGRSSWDDGAAYVFELDRGVWHEAAKLQAGDRARKDTFGFSVSLVDDEVLIGAPGHGEAGAAYLFQRDRGVWSAAHKLLPSMGKTGDQFGASVALAHRFLLIGADESTLVQDGHHHPSHDHGHHRLHHSHHYHRQGYARWRKHHGHRGHGHHGHHGHRHRGHGGHHGHHGHRRHLHHDDHHHDGRVYQAGAVYIFERQAADWSEVDILTPSQARRYAHFGFAVALDGDHALVGAPALTRGRHGRVYAYHGFQSNAAPEILSTPVETARVGALYEYPVVAIDADDDPLDYTLTTAPSGMQIDVVSGLIQWIPDTPGEVTVELEVRDEKGGVATQSYTITVAPNHPPVITSTPITSATTGALYQYRVEAIDPDFDPLTYRLQIFPPGMVIDPNGDMRWTPNTPGEVRIQVEVDDARGGLATQSFVISAVVPNHAPEIISTPITELNRFYLVPQVSITDTYLADQSITLNGKPYTPGTEITSTGDYELTIKATDEAGNISVTTIQFTIETEPAP